MAHQKPDATGAGKEITCLDDAPNVARLAARQQFLSKWSRVLALAPFAALVFVAFKFFPGTNSSNGWAQVLLVLAAVIWALAVAGYTVYIYTAVRCPGCHSRFGLGEKCRSCGLPRHRDAPRN
jgi:hypothetical protein